MKPKKEVILRDKPTSTIIKTTILGIVVFSILITSYNFNPNNLLAAVLFTFIAWGLEVLFIERHNLYSYNNHSKTNLSRYAFNVKEFKYNSWLKNFIFSFSSAFYGFISISLLLLYFFIIYGLF